MTGDPHGHALRSRIEHVVSALEAYAAAREQGEAPVPRDELPPPQPEGDTLPTLVQLALRLGLSGFEVDLLALCAGMETDARIPALCARCNGSPELTTPTVGLALAALPGAHWGAVTPHAPLRRWGLLSLESAPTLTSAPVRLDERVWQYLLGIDEPDRRLESYAAPPPDAGPRVPSLDAVVDAARGLLVNNAAPRTPVVQLIGPDHDSRMQAAAQLGDELLVPVLELPIRALPRGTEALGQLITLLEREALLSGTLPLIECGSVDASDPHEFATLERLVTRLSVPLLVGARERLEFLGRPSVVLDVHHPAVDEQRALWRGAFPPEDLSDEDVEQLVCAFDLSARTIAGASAQAASLGAGDEDTPLPQRLWAACKAQVRPRLEHLAQRLPVDVTPRPLVLPEAQTQLLDLLEAHARHRLRVHDDWGFGVASRGSGTSVLFSGPSGTGKTHAAEVLASRLGLDLFRVDLSAVVSKYIGETEKNLRQVFDAAECGGVLLLFDEADALFGKRSNVKDAHDRHANIEVSYLLQRIEGFRGLAILTTNLKDSLDHAFLRRLRFVVDFPFPDEDQRARLWEHAFPASAPLDGVDTRLLARLDVAGGTIRNIAVNAAYIAVNRSPANPGIRMEDLLEATRAEYRKLQKPLMGSEVHGWV